MTTKKSLPKRATKGPIAARLRFNKMGILALAAVLSLAGAVYVYSSHAATGCVRSKPPVVFLCPYNAAGIKHSGGSVIAENVYWPETGGTYFGTRKVWKATFNQTSSPNGRYMWYGPNATVSIPPNQNLQVCWDYIGSAGLSVTFSIAYNNDGAYQVIEIPMTLEASHRRYIGSTPYYQVQHFCPGLSPNDPTHVVVYSGIQIRLKINPGSNNNLPLWIYKTTYAVGSVPIPALSTKDD